MLRILTLCALLALPGCEALNTLSQASESLNAYELRGSGAGVGAARQLNRDLTIEAVTVSGALATDRILIRPSPLEAQYLPGARWTDEAPDMIRTVLVRRFEATGGFRFVGRRPLAAVGDYALLTELTDLEAELGPREGLTGENAATARIGLIATLVREDDAAVLGRRVFSAAVPTSGTSATAVVTALDQAMSRLFGELGPWVLSNLGAGVRQAGG
ncbi:ABC-type transport auxiliary lipoprotein family protein [Poseidonocella sedimentorum]|uniref:Cholesterol transport system auxiliary component n=1 Tax=Poseidonocella sedimentorum TaxID=871652 RepID=A0A1I6E890_9RHOB|nr:ABC-type transport auxiliary lipoprotein family protein [Poseidonocella sedimentorum]SFR13950.1 cholesterol transport system auxiliary component [Poseidonocella sedimentorum]